MAPGTDLERIEPDQSDLDWLADDVTRTVADAKGKGWHQCVATQRRFVRWLEQADIGFEEVKSAAPRGEHGQPVIPWLLVEAWISSLIRADQIKPRTLGQYFHDLMRWFKVEGWTNGDSARARISERVANYRIDDTDAHQRQVTRPVLEEDVESITNAIDSWFDAPKVTDLWVESQRTFHLVGSISACRISELTTHARWSWFEDHGDHFVMVSPGENLLKYQPNPVTVIIPERGDRYCPVAQIRRWKAACEAAGIPTDGQAMFLPQVRKWSPMKAVPRIEADAVDKFAIAELAGISPITAGKWLQAAGIESCGKDGRRKLYPADDVQSVLDNRVANGTGIGGSKEAERFGDRMFIADPIAERLADPTFSPDEDPEARLANARAGHVQTYRSAWQAAAQAAGFVARHRFEKVAPHGLRRGRATCMAMNGAHVLTIAYHLRHGSNQVVARYLDAEAIPYPDTRVLVTVDATALAGDAVPITQEELEELLG